MDKASCIAVAVVTLLCNGCNGSTDHVSDTVRLAVDSAIKNGKSTATINVVPEMRTWVSLEYVAKEFSIAEVGVRTLSAAVSSQFSIETWHVLTGVRRSGDSPLRGPCTLALPDGLHLGAGDLATPLVASGSVTARGVTVTATSLDSLVQLEPRGRYLAILAQCSPAVARLVFGPFGIFRVGPSGELSAIRPLTGHHQSPHFNRILELGTVDAVFAEVQAVHERQASADAGIIRALLRDIAIPWRDGSSRTSSRPIAILTDSLQLCPQPPAVVRGCVAPDVVKLAMAEEAKGTWSSDLVGELATRLKTSVRFDQLDVSAFDRVITGPKAELDFNTVLPIALSRPAVVGRTALVYVQFATTFNWLVLLTEQDDGWGVTTKIANGSG